MVMLGESGGGGSGWGEWWGRVVGIAVNERGCW